MRIYTHGGSSSRWTAAAVLAALLPSGGCEMEWGGATVALINPAPVPAEAADAVDSLAVDVVEPLPQGDLLYLVRFVGADDRARAVPIARMAGGVPADLGLPEEIGERYRARFDSALFARDLELPLHAGGHRIGTLILDGEAEMSVPGCVSVGGGRPLLLPDAELPAYAFAWAGEAAAGWPAAYDLAATDTRMRTYGPVLAEDLLRRGGETRPYLAQRAAMRAVPWQGDERPAMTATYLVNDDLGAAPPDTRASSLFFLARYDGRKYVPEWWEVRRYGGDGAREAFIYLGALAGPEGRVDFATRHDGTSVRIVASVDREGQDRSIDWTEDERCPALRLIEAAASPTGAGGAGPSQDAPSS